MSALASQRSAARHRRREDADSVLLKALASGEMYEGDAPVTTRETHASWVFLAGDRAYKVKKPLALGFLDYNAAGATARM